MRRSSLRLCFALALAAVVAAMTGQTGPADASGNAKITRGLATAAAHARPGEELRVIVSGTAAREASAAHGTVGRSLALVGSVAAKIRAGELPSLARQQPTPPP